MAKKNIIPTRIYPDPCGATPYFVYYSTGPIHLFAWFLEPQPGAQPYITGHRGIRQRIRYRLRTRYSFCVEQLEPGPTTQHTFRLPTRPDGTTAYLAFSDHCSVRFAGTTTPPLPYTYHDCDSAAAYVALTDSADKSIGGQTIKTLPWDDLLYGNPAMKGINHIIIVQNGIYRLSFYGRFRTCGLATVGERSIEAWISPTGATANRGATTKIWLDTPNQEVTITLAWEGFLSIVDVPTCYAIPICGAGGYEFLKTETTPFFSAWRIG